MASAPKRVIRHDRDCKSAAYGWYGLAIVSVASGDIEHRVVFIISCYRLHRPVYFIDDHGRAMLIHYGFSQGS